MASFSFEMPTELMNQLEKLANIDEIAPKMINKATPIVADSIKYNVRKHKQSGDLERSVKVKKASNGKSGGYYGKVYFDGYGSDKQRTPNDLKANVIEYGTKDRTAEPFMDKSVNDVEQNVNDAMQEVFNREVGGEW
ncbi:HK97 gp10 family phage protein [Ruminiclostridium cellobioparum]|uniref:Phage protein, HK97 gp10 family n=1 Tax=Ruminiclostridium cellobioparum subsp. termitidis CT1112 TaxID=1195236 RepID=S0FP72_RUMCE|nr:HK97 gp10 family phage protein [Ruminiclostridium cellobioparum]EMS74030.1 phage protein, HK97 gp10 family [Ruminiclostridium cellobioparum subsp. termitidis CT1112]